MKESTIEAILSTREWDGPHGLLYFYRLKMADGITGEIAKKKPDAFQVGQVLRYTMEEAVNKATGEGYWKLKEVKDEPQGFGGQAGSKGYGDPKAMLMSFAKDCVVAEMAYKADLPVADTVIDYATKFLAWYNGADTVSVIPEVTGVVEGAPPEIEAQREVEYDEPDLGYAEPVKPAQTASTAAVATSLTNMITSKQLGMVRAVAREAKLDADAECQALLGCTVDELSKKAASDLIEHLQVAARRK